MEEQRDRSKFLGGSDAPVVLGISKWRTPAQLAEEKRRPRVEDDGKAESRKPQLLRGKRWEPVAREMLVDRLIEMGHDVRVIATNQSYKDKEHPFLAAEIDAELMFDGEHVNCEIKTVHPFALKEWGIVDADSLINSLPIYYEAQVQHGMMVSGRDRCIACALVGADFVVPIVTDRDDALIAEIRRREIEFWQRYVLGGETPPAINFDDVKRLYKADLDAIEATPDVQSASLRLRAVRAEIKARELEVEALCFDIGRFMGTHQLLIDSQGNELVTFKAQSGTFLDQAGLKKDYPALVKTYTRGWETRVLRTR